MARVTVALKGPGHYSEEGVAAEAITPGHLVKGVTSIGKQTVTTFVPANFALERDEFGKEITVDYAVGDVVKIGSFRKGDRVYALVVSGAGTVNADTQLESAGDGTLAAGTTNPLARSLDALGLVTVATRVRVEIL